MMSRQPLRIARYQVDGQFFHGRVDGETLVRWTGAPWQGGKETDVRDASARVRLLAPVVPTKIVCVGLNYQAHVTESVTKVPGGDLPSEPLLFFKPPSAVIGHGDTIRYPEGVTRLDPEGEMAVVMGRRARRVTAQDALSHVAGITCLNDVSARNYQRSDGQWARAKGFDTFAPIGPWIVMGLDPAPRRVACSVNGVVRQEGNTADLLFPVPFLIQHISRIMTLEPGDVIATGTPAGVAPVEIGDRIQVEVEGVGILENLVGAQAETG